MSTPSLSPTAWGKWKTSVSLCSSPKGVGPYGLCFPQQKTKVIASCYGVIFGRSRRYIRLCFGLENASMFEQI